MTVQSTDRVAGPYLCDGLTTQFPFDFKVFVTSDIVAVLSDGSGNETDLVLSSDYMVNLSPNQDANPGGTVVTYQAYPAGRFITLTSDVPYTQPDTLSNQGGFYPKVIEHALDRLTILLQQLGLGIRRALSLGISDTDGSGAYRANGNRIQDLGDPIANRDAVHRQWVDARISEAAIDGAGQFVVERLADDTDPANGPGMIGYPNGLPSQDYPLDTVGGQLDGLQSQLYTQPLWGRAGARVILGAQYDAHYGWGGIVVLPSGKWLQIYRKGTDHGVRDGSELRARDSFDDGATWVNDRLVCPTGTYDLRPDPPRMMANGRAGFLVNRQTEGVGHYSPWFVYTDDEGATFPIVEITTSSPYTFTGTHALIDWPSSQGGNDTTGFASFGYLSAGGIDMLATADNGATWQQIHDVATPSGDVGNISESAAVRVGNSDRWLIFSRARPSGGVGWRDMLTVFATTDLTDWGTPRDAGLDLGGNPVSAMYDEGTDQIHVLSFARSGRPIDGFDQHLLRASADAEALYAAQGDFATLGVGYQIVTPIPSWATGYIAPFRHRGQWYGTATCGETGNAGGNRGVQVLIGDFMPSAMDTALLTLMFVRRQEYVERVRMRAADNVNTTYPLSISNASGTATLRIGAYRMTVDMGGAQYEIEFNNPPRLRGQYLFGGLDSAIAEAPSAAIQSSPIGATGSAFASVVFSSAARTHNTFVNTAGVVGSITTSAGATAYNTTSDETYKIFLREYPAEEAIAVILADPVREWEWVPERGGGRAIGWGAQTSYAVRQDLASPGGWFDAEGNEVSPQTEGATYKPWGSDQGKRTAYLWPATAWLIQGRQTMQGELDDLRARLEALEQNNA